MLVTVQPRAEQQQLRVHTVRTYVRFIVWLSGDINRWYKDQKLAHIHVNRDKTKSKAPAKKNSEEDSPIWLGSGPDHEPNTSTIGFSFKKKSPKFPIDFDFNKYLTLN